MAVSVVCVKILILYLTYLIDDTEDRIENRPSNIAQKEAPYSDEVITFLLLFHKVCLHFLL